MHSLSNTDDLRDTQPPWNQGYTAGYRRGTDDGHAELDGTYRRNPDHTGNPYEPPDNLDTTDLDAWADGFLTGYADGRNQALRGAA